MSKKFSDVLNGNFENLSNELAGGARINYTFHTHFSRYVSNLKPLEGVSDESIRTLLYNSSGSSSIVVFPHTAFERLTKNSIANLKPHSLKLVNIIFNELVKIVHQIVSSTNLPRFPALQEKVANSLIALFKRKSEETHNTVATFINWNVNYLSAKHPDFIKWSDLFSREEKPDNAKQAAENTKDKKITFDAIPSNSKITGQFTEHELVEIGMMKSLVTSYFELTKKIVIDQVPKAIMSELVMNSEMLIHETLFREIYECKGIEDLVCESIESIEKRKKVERTIVALRQAYDIMCSI